VIVYIISFIKKRISTFFRELHPIIERHAMINTKSLVDEHKEMIIMPTYNKLVRNRIPEIIGRPTKKLCFAIIFFFASDSSVSSCKSLSTATLNLRVSAVIFNGFKWLTDSVK